MCPPLRLMASNGLDGCEVINAGHEPNYSHSNLLAGLDQLQFFFICKGELFAAQTGESDFHEARW